MDFSYPCIPVCWIEHCLLVHRRELLQALRVKVKLGIVVLDKLSIFMKIGKFTSISTHTFLLMCSLFFLEHLKETISIEILWLENWVFVVLLSIFAHTPTHVRTPAPICACSCTYACSFTQTLTHACTRTHVLMHAYRRENDKSRKFF